MQKNLGNSTSQGYQKTSRLKTALKFKLDNFCYNIYVELVLISKRVKLESILVSNQ